MDRMGTWSRGSVERLIELYEERRCLYDVGSPDYHNKVKRNSALQEISFYLADHRPGVTADEVKLKINGLRTQFMAEKNKTKKCGKSGAGTGDIYVPSLWCYKSLQFLERHSAPRQSISNLPCSNNELLQSSDDRGEDDELRQISTAEVDIDKLPLSSESLASPVSTSGPSRVPGEKCGKRKRVEQRSADLMEFLSNATSVLQEAQGKKCMTSCEHIGKYVGQELNSIKNKRVQQKTILKIQQILLEATEEDEMKLNFNILINRLHNIKKKRRATNSSSKNNY